MIDALGEAVAGTVAERMVTRLGPALVFATGGAVAWLSAHGGWDRLVSLGEQAAQLPTLVMLAVLTVVVAATFAATTLVRLLTRPVLRLMEGHGLPPQLRRVMVRRRANQQTALAQQLRALAAATDGPDASPADQDRMARVDARLRRMPSARWLMPTRLGNLLRAAETRPFEKYGLDTIAVWPHLWLALPDAARADLAASRASLDRAVTCVIWAAAFLPFSLWNVWALPIGIVLAAWAVGLWAPFRAARYADLLEAAYDVHRVRLYRSLRWPLPANPDDERREGARLTTYLVRGLSGQHPRFEEVSRP